MEDLKQMIQDDVENVFLDLEMFGESHMVAGREQTIILDDLEKLKRNGSYLDLEAMHKDRKMFYVSADGFGRMPSIGKLIDLDGEEFQVKHAEEEGGLYAITIEAYKGYGR